MAKRPYTGWDRNARGKRAGTEKMIAIINYLSDGGLWHNGSFGIRPMRGKSRPSVHGTGRACDISWRGGKYGGFGKHSKAKVWVDFLTENATELQLEAIFDYYPAPYGTGYKSDRDYTIKYTKKAFSGAPGGDWIHVEVAPAVADDADFFQRRFTELIGKLKTDADIKEVSPVEDDLVDSPGPEDFPGHDIDVGHEHKDEVKAIQMPLGVTIDGDFGPATLASLKRFQGEHDLAETEAVDERTWNAMFGTAAADSPPYPGRPVKKDDTGDSVKVIQAKVDAYVDGIFGAKTEESVKTWQGAHRLEVDGLVGRNTWAAMFP